MAVEKRSRLILAACSGAHAVQDGLSAAVYVLLPVLAQAFGLGYAQVAAVKAVKNCAMLLFEVPSGMLSERLGESRLLVFGLACAGSGYILFVAASGLWTVLVCLTVAGMGMGFQHALSSSIVSSAFERQGRRSALGLYNSSGDAGKLVFTALFSLAIGMGLAWQSATTLFGLVALATAVAVFLTLRKLGAGRRMPVAQDHDAEGRSLGWGIRDGTGFAALCLAVFLDSAVQAGFLTFLAFLIAEKGVSLGYAAFAVALTLTGGMLGKAACGFLAERVGVRSAFVSVQCLSAVGIAAVLVAPPLLAFCLLPVVGAFLQGSTSITYGLVGDLVHGRRKSRGFALIYSVTNLSAMIGPIAFGLLGDHFGLASAISAMAVVSLLAIPPCLLLHPRIAATY